MSTPQSQILTMANAFHFAYINLPDGKTGYPYAGNGLIVWMSDDQKLTEDLDGPEIHVLRTRELPGTALVKARSH